MRWQAPVSGPRVVTYRIASDTVESPDARNCRKITKLDGLLASSELSTAVVREEIAAAFRMWEAAADLLFREATGNAPADILIGAQGEPEGWAFADVFYDAASPEPIKPISRALVCLNPLRPWKVGFDGDLKSYDIRYTVAHEIGHADRSRSSPGFRPDHGLPLRGTFPQPAARRRARCGATVWTSAAGRAGRGCRRARREPSCADPPGRRAPGNQRLHRTFSLSSRNHSGEWSWVAACYCGLSASRCRSS